MTRLWNIRQSRASAERLDELYDMDPPGFDWINRDEIGTLAMDRGEVLDGAGGSLGQVRGVDLSDAPAPRLRCADPGYAPDLIFWGELFVSARLAGVLAPEPGAAQLLPVDCSECPPAMRGKEYALLNVLAFANPMDRERSLPAEFADVPLPGGGSTYVWRYGGTGPGGPMPRVVWRDDFVAPAPLFRVPGLSWMLATDELAGRVGRAGFPDVAFGDLTVG